MRSIPVGTWRNSHNNLKRSYLGKKTFSYFLLHFGNVHETSNILKKKDVYPSLVISKIIDSEVSGYLNLQKVLL